MGRRRQVSVRVRNRWNRAFLAAASHDVILTLATLTGGVGIYAAIVLLIDKYARGLVVEIIRQLPKISRRNSTENN